MLARALIVLLLVLNLGVASWWLWRAPPVPDAVQAPVGVERLRLLSEVPAAARKPAVVPLPTIVADQCVGFGPFAAPQLAVAQRRLLGLVQRLHVRAVVAPTRGWQVQIPPQADAEAAQALAQRIAAAGFKDLLVLHDGADANAIALGRYRGEDSARQRAAALVAAGFPARVEPVADANAQSWLDVAAVPAFDAALARKAIAAPRLQAIDCASVP